MPRVAFWATSFQADIQALACFLAERPGYEVWVALDDPEGYASEPVNRLLPFTGRLLDRTARATRRELERFAPDLLIVDNHLPSQAFAPRLLVLWHGFGWRVDDLGRMREELARLVGDVTVPNSRFRWAAFGKWDRDYRINHSGLAPENVVALGSPYSDLLRPESDVRACFDRADVADCYRIDVVGRKTVLVGLTWHHGGALAHWGDDDDLLARLCSEIEARDANVLLRMHDRQRYEKSEVRRIEKLAARFEHVELKWKSEHPDSLVDLLVSDVMVSNYSSFLNAFYYTERPTIHVEPMDVGAAEHLQRVIRKGKLRSERITNPQSSWKLPPDQIGGLRAQNFDELLAHLGHALAQPGCCVEGARAFCTQYVTGVDGRARERVVEVMEQWP